MSQSMTPDERAMAAEHRDDIERTLLADADDLYDRLDKLARTAAQCRDNLEFLEDSEAPVEDVEFVLEMMGELTGDQMVYLRRERRQVESLLDELRLVEEDLE